MPLINILRALFGFLAFRISQLRSHIHPLFFAIDSLSLSFYLSLCGVHRILSILFYSSNAKYLFRRLDWNFAMNFPFEFEFVQSFRFVCI